MQKEAITYDYLHVQSHDQCKIQEVYASRNKILFGYKCEVLKTYWQYLKSTQKKKMLQSIEKVTNIEYKQKLKNRVYYIEVMNKDRKSTRLNSSHSEISRMPSSA